jgi:hypothetical protein
MAYGPSQGENTYDTLNGPLGKLQQGDIAMSPNIQKQYGGLGARVDLLDPRTGQPILSNQRIADHSYTSPGNPTKNTIEIWNGQDLGHVQVVPSQQQPSQIAGSPGAPGASQQQGPMTSAQDYANWANPGGAGAAGGGGGGGLFGTGLFAGAGGGGGTGGGGTGGGGGAGLSSLGSSLSSIGSQIAKSVPSWQMQPSAIPSPDTFKAGEQQQAVTFQQRKQIV